VEGNSVSDMAILPEEIRQIIFAVAGNPRITEACREWRQYTGFYHQLFFDFAKNRSIQPFMPQSIPATDQDYADVIKETVLRVRRYYHEYHEVNGIDLTHRSIDENSLSWSIQRSMQYECDLSLINFFELLPIEHPSFPQNLLFAEKARLIREWMEIHHDLLMQVDRLDLSGLYLYRIPPEIGKLTNLRDLDLSNNDLSELPWEIDQLVNLNVLDLSHNLFTKVPREICRTDLVYLDLSENQITEQLPREIYQLDLHFVDIEGNSFADLEGVLAMFRELIPECTVRS